MALHGKAWHRQDSCPRASRKGKWGCGTPAIGETKMTQKQILVKCIDCHPAQDGGLYGRYIVGSFMPGKGVTIASMLRRGMLSELPGIAFFGVKIEGVKHEYCTMRGVRESVLDITCNLKEVVLAGRLPRRDLSQFVFGHLDIKGPTTIRAGDIKLPPSLRCVNPEQYIATLAHDGRLKLKAAIDGGRNYLLHTSARNKQLVEQDLLPIDANFMPFRKVNFLLRPDHRGKALTEQLWLEIWSNGSLDHIEGIRRAAKSMGNLFLPYEGTKLDTMRGDLFFQRLVNLPPLEERETWWRREKPAPPRFLHERLKFSRHLPKMKTRPEDDLRSFDLSMKTLIYLKRNNIETGKQLLSTLRLGILVVPKDILLEIEAFLFEPIGRWTISRGHQSGR